MRSIARRHANKTRMKQYITPTLTVRPIIHEGMLCVSMRQRTLFQINDQYQSGSTTEEEVNGLFSSTSPFQSPLSNPLDDETDN